MDNALEDALKRVESARKQERYGLMKRLANRVFVAIKHIDRREKYQVRARLLYEHHMALYQQSVAAAGPERLSLLRGSLRVARQSGIAAEKAGDRVGVLFADQNISGLLLSALGHPTDAIRISKETAVKAERIGRARRTKRIDRKRARRVAVNCYLHQLRMQTAGKFDVHEVRDLLKKIRANQIYRTEFRHIVDINKQVDDAEARVRLDEVAARLGVAGA